MSIDHSTPVGHIDVEFPEEWPQLREWGTEVLLVQTPHFTMKRLEMRAGKMGGLQRHQVKDEAFTVGSGVVEVHHDLGDGQLHKVILRQGETCHIPPGAAHRVLALSDAVLYESSNVIWGDREHLEPKYGEEIPPHALPDEHPRNTPNV